MRKLIEIIKALIKEVIIELSEINEYGHVSETIKRIRDDYFVK